MKCEICGATENLQIHHISYEPEITQILCIGCHQNQHPKHGVGPSRGNGNHPLFDELQEEFIMLSDKGRTTRKEVAKRLGISYMTAYLWDKMLGIKRCKGGWKREDTYILHKKEGEKIKTINVSFEDEEMKAIEKAKRGQSWRKFILERAAIDSSNELHTKGINADALRGLCLEYDLSYGPLLGGRFEGFSFLCFFLEKETSINPEDKKERETWGKQIAELKKKKEEGR